MTPLLAALGTGLAGVAGAGLIARQQLLAEAAAVLLLILAGRALLSFVHLAPPFLTSRAPTVRVLAGQPVAATATPASGP